jgi:flagellar motility protein MotE (MotC chaperone)
VLEILFTIVLASTPPTAPVAPKVAEPVAPSVPEVGKPVETKPEVKAEEPAPAKVDQADAPLPPALTRKALCGEMTRTSRELAAARKRLDEDRKALDGERQQLEKLKAEITQARAGLRSETEKLEALLARRAAEPAPAETPKPAPARPTPPAPRPQELDALAKTMKSMKPEAAAALIARTDAPLAAALLKRMKPADAGAVMDRLKPELAADLLALMSTLPSTPTKPGGRL